MKPQPTFFNSRLNVIICVVSLKSRSILCSSMLLIALVFSSETFAYNFLKYNKTTHTPLGWEPGTTIEYYLDPGPYGKYTNEQAHTLLKEAMRVWESAPNANVPTFVFAGYLPEDVTKENYKKYFIFNDCYTDVLDFCDSEGQKQLRTAIVFNNNNEILNSHLSGRNAAAFASPLVFEGSWDTPGYIRQGTAVFGTSWQHLQTVGDEVGLFVHELGHLLGLSHLSLNQQLLSSTSNGNTFYLATMQTKGTASFAQGLSKSATLNPDDIAGISVLYPGTHFHTETASIRGTVLKADGTPMTYANVVVRNVNDPWCEAYSFLSGRSCETGSTPFCEESGRADGAFLIQGLSPGTYTVEVEGLRKDIADGMSPEIYESSFPGEAEFWNERDAADEDPLTATPLTLRAGEEHSDTTIVLSSTTGDPLSWGIAKMIPETHFIRKEDSICKAPLADYNALIGVAPDEEAEPPGGGCSLLPGLSADR